MSSYGGRSVRPLPVQMNPTVAEYDDINLEVQKITDGLNSWHGVDKSLDSVSQIDLSYNESVNFSPSSQASCLSSSTSINSRLSDLRNTSNYWRIPDHDPYLTSIALKNDGKLCAIGSGNAQSNLFIYEVYPDEVTHHQTITLPEVENLQWISPSTNLGRMGNVLASGHRDGVAHLTLIPDSTARDSCAEILKRYNHIKHIRSDVTNLQRSFRIRSLELTSAKWACCATSSLFTLCGGHLFLWEPNRSDVPLVMQKTYNTYALSLCGSRDGVFALGRRRGVCIRDIRVRDKVNSGLKPPVDNDGVVTEVSWNPYDGGNQFAAVHDRRTIKLWDIRSREPLASYDRHADSVTTLDWYSKTQLVSSSADGTIRLWNTLNTSYTPKRSSLGVERKSAWSDYTCRQSLEQELDGFANDLLHEKPPVNQSRKFVSMALAPTSHSVKAVTVDNGGFLGVHEILAESGSGSNSLTTSFNSSSDIDYPPDLAF